MSFTIGWAAALALTCADASPVGKAVEAANPTAVMTADRRAHREFLIQSPHSVQRPQAGRAAAALAQIGYTAIGAPALGKPGSSRSDDPRHRRVALYAEKLCCVTNLISAAGGAAAGPDDRNGAC